MFNILMLVVSLLIIYLLVSQEVFWFTGESLTQKIIKKFKKPAIEPPVKKRGRPAKKAGDA